VLANLTHSTFKYFYEIIIYLTDGLKWTGIKGTVIPVLN
jgi:hypothetical protein